jgi:hypothetical protein
VARGAPGGAPGDVPKEARGRALVGASGLGGVGVNCLLAAQRTRTSRQSNSRRSIVNSL